MKKTIAVAVLLSLVAMGAVYAQNNGNKWKNSERFSAGADDIDDVDSVNCLGTTDRNCFTNTQPGNNGMGNAFGAVNAPWFGWIMPRWHSSVGGVAVMNNNAASFEPFRINFRMWRGYVNDQNTYDTWNTGVLRLGSQNFALKNSTFVNGTFSAEVYRNSIDVGSVRLTINQNNNWYGQLNVDNTIYNAYIVGMQRMFWHEEWPAQTDDW